MEFGDEVLTFRAEHGLTQAEMAEILETAPGMVYKYESGRVNPTRANLIRYRKRMDEWLQQKTKKPAAE